MPQGKVNMKTCFHFIYITLSTCFLVEDLGLAQVRHTRVKDLTVSEKQRLNVACHLLLDADIVVLDQPTRGMDIFDTFFLVEYLRQWAARGRIVILTLQVLISYAELYQKITYLCSGINWFLVAIHFFLCF